MHIVVVGLNYRTAPVEVREQFAFAENDLPAALHELMQTKSVLEGLSSPPVTGRKFMWSWTAFICADISSAALWSSGSM